MVVQAADDPATDDPTGCPTWPRYRSVANAIRSRAFAAASASVVPQRCTHSGRMEAVGGEQIRCVASQNRGVRHVHDTAACLRPRGRRTIQHVRAQTQHVPERRGQRGKVLHRRDGCHQDRRYGRGGPFPRPQAPRSLERGAQRLQRQNPSPGRRQAERVVDAEDDDDEVCVESRGGLDEFLQEDARRRTAAAKCAPGDRTAGSPPRARPAARQPHALIRNTDTHGRRLADDEQPDRCRAFTRRSLPYPSASGNRGVTRPTRRP